MILTGEILFIALLAFLLMLLYKNEKWTKQGRLSHALIEECWDGKDRRKCTRFQKNLDVIYNLEKKPHLKNNSKTLDISESGAKLLLDKKFSKDTILDLKIELPDTQEPVEMEGRVVWSEEVKDTAKGDKRLFHTGIEFTALKEPAGKSLTDYIRSLARGT